MRAFPILLILLLVALPATSRAGSGQAADSVSAWDDEWIVLPAVFYTPETGTGGGPFAVWNLRHGTNDELSSVFASVFYTEKKQTLMQLFPDVVFGDGRWRLAGQITYQHYPQTFYGIGPGPGVEEDYASEAVNVLLSLQRRLRPGIFAGPRLFFRRERVYERDPGGLIDTGIRGAEKWTATGAGFIATRDTRDDRLLPRRGSFAEIAFLACAGALGGDYDYRTGTLDLRLFRAPGGRGVVAARGWLGLAGGDVPFQELPSIGGLFVLRGYPQSRFRDRAAWASQLEYRTGSWWRFGGVLFAAAGGVAGAVDEFAVDGIEASAGAGIRFRIGEAGSRLRIDMGFGHRSSGFYFVMNEAF